jgi:hypothetical protein
VFIFELTSALAKPPVANKACKTTSRNFVRPIHIWFHSLSHANFTSFLVILEDFATTFLFEENWNPDMEKITYFKYRCNYYCRLLSSSHRHALYLGYFWLVVDASAFLSHVFLSIPHHGSNNKNRF